MKILTDDEAIELLEVLNQFVVALDRIGSNYKSDKTKAMALLYLMNKEEGFHKLSKARQIMMNKYSYDLAEDQDFSEVEKITSAMSYFDLPSEDDLALWVSKLK